MHCQQFQAIGSRREFFGRAGLGVGAAALAHLLAPNTLQAGGGLPNFAPKAKRVICLFQSGGPSHLELLDPKPLLKKTLQRRLAGLSAPRPRITGMVSGQARLAMQPSKYGFTPSGQSGIEIGDLLPYTQKIADDICVIRSMNTEAINHDPAITFLSDGQSTTWSSESRCLGSIMVWAR